MDKERVSRREFFKSVGLVSLVPISLTQVSTSNTGEPTPSNCINSNDAHCLYQQIGKESACPCEYFAAKEAS